MDKKVGIDLGRGISTLLIGIAAMLIAAAVAVDGKKDYVIIQVFLLILAAINLFAVARTLGWIIDRISDDIWNEVYTVERASKKQFQIWTDKFDGAYFRCTIYGGAYAVITLTVSSIISLCFYFTILRLQQVEILPILTPSDHIFNSTKFYASIFVFVFTSYQMLTKKSRNGYLFFAGCASVGLMSFIKGMLLSGS